jgi:hypothetical protein
MEGYTNSFQGVTSIHRAVINIKQHDDATGKKGDLELLVEGYGLQRVMVTPGTYISTLRFSPSHDLLKQVLLENRRHLIMS